MRADGHLQRVVSQEESLLHLVDLHLSVSSISTSPPPLCKSCTSPFPSPPPIHVHFSSSSILPPYSLPSLVFTHPLLILSSPAPSPTFLYPQSLPPSLPHSCFLILSSLLARLLPSDPPQSLRPPLPPTPPPSSRPLYLPHPFIPHPLLLTSFCSPRLLYLPPPQFLSLSLPSFPAPLGLIIHEGSSVYRIFKRWQAVNQQWKVLNYEKSKDLGDPVTSGGKAGTRGGGGGGGRGNTGGLSGGSGTGGGVGRQNRRRFRTILHHHCGYTILHILSQLRPNDPRISAAANREVVMRVTTV